MTDFNASLYIFMLLFAIRYVRLLVGVFANILYKPYPVKSKPRYCAKDVTVIVPTTFKRPLDLVTCLESILDCQPARVLAVTANPHVERISGLCHMSGLSGLEVLGVDHLNKRRQMLLGLELVGTPIVVFADDNVVWPSGYLTELLAVFEVPNVGAGGTRQRVLRKHDIDMWNFLAISYLERRVFNNITTQAVDGSISTLSGRTAAYRTCILKTVEFFEFFVNDTWLGRPLNTDDDKCLTRYVYSHGWGIAIQGSAVIETKMEDGWAYIEQCKRWARAHWRGNFTVMTNETYWYRYLWGLYAIYIAQFQTPALLVDGVLVYMLHNAVKDLQDRVAWYCSFGVWLLFTKIVKLLPHFRRHPRDIRFIPLSILFAYIHGVINIWALCTMHVTIWGSQHLKELEQPRSTGGSIVPLFEDAD